MICLLYIKGGEYRGYDTDITRTFPVNGRFSEPQRAVYEAVLDAQRVGESLCKPGALIVDMAHNITARLTKFLIDRQLINHANGTHCFVPHGFMHRYIEFFPLYL